MSARTCVVCLQPSATVRPLPSDDPSSGDCICTQCTNLIVAAPEPVHAGDWRFTALRGQNMRAPIVVASNARTARTLRIPAPLPMVSREPEVSSS